MGHFSRIMLTCGRHLLPVERVKAADNDSERQREKDGIEIGNCGLLLSFLLGEVKIRLARW